MGFFDGILGFAGNMIAAKQQQNFQRGMFNEQKKFWYEQQDYNSPANQVKRFEEAGLNPQFMLGNIQSGSMGSMPSPGQGAAAQAASFGDLSTSMLNYVRGKTEKKLADANEQNIKSDAFLKEIDGITRGMKNMAEIAEIVSRKDKQLGEAILARVSAGSQQVMTSIAQDKARLEMAELQTRIESNVIHNAMAIEELKVLPQKNQLFLQQIGADIALKLATKELTLEQAKRIWFESNDLWHTSEGKRIDNELKQKTFNAVVERTIQETLPAIGRYGSNYGDWNSSRKYGEYPE